MMWMDTVEIPSKSASSATAGATAALAAASTIAPTVEGRPIALSDLARGAFATVSAVVPAHSAEDRDLVLRLIEIGFVPGERLRVVAHGRPGREPIAVRLYAGGNRTTGGTTFALRRFEADYIRVLPDRAANNKVSRP